MKFNHILVLIILNTSYLLNAQQIILDVTDTSGWLMTEPSMIQIDENVVTIDATNNNSGGMMLLKDYGFEEGEIEFDVQGSNSPGRSFVGFAFNAQNTDLYEAIYFRPFNFHNPERKSHALQYMSLPAYPWRALRTNFPNVYERAISSAPDPDEWFHVRLVLTNGVVKVFVDHQKEPTMIVERIPLVHEGGIGIWVGSNTKGSFKNLVIRPQAKPVYGYDSSAGEYFEVAPDTKLYYEVYGEGEPILMLHGGVYGYIDEYASFINELVKTNQVICLGTRGHVKSDIGHDNFSFEQRANDAKKLLDHLAIEKTEVIGFSDGGLSAFKLAASFPERVSKMVVIGAGEVPANNGPVKYTSAELLNSDSLYFTKRLAHMPEPNRWGESVLMLNDLYNNHRIGSETFKNIKCPVLLLAGANDEFASPKRLMAAFDQIQDAHIAIVPDCGHVVFYCNWEATWASIAPFILK